MLCASLSTNMLVEYKKEIDALRKDGTTKVVECQSAIAGIKRDKTLSKGEKESEIAACEKELQRQRLLRQRTRMRFQSSLPRLKAI